MAVNVQCIYLRVRTCDCEQIQSVSECCEAHSVSQHLRPVSSSLCTCHSVFYLVFWCQIVSISCVLKFWPLLPAVTCRVLGLPVFHFMEAVAASSSSCCLAEPQWAALSVTLWRVRGLCSGPVLFLFPAECRSVMWPCGPHYSLSICL